MPIPRVASQDHSDDEAEPAGAFRVALGNLVRREADDESFAAAERIWSRVRQMFPQSRIEKISELFVWNETLGGGSVIRNWDLRGWQLNVDTNLRGEELDYLLLHEFGHVLTLDLAEMTLLVDPSACATVAVDISCANVGSVVDRFTTRFWSVEMAETATEPDGAEALYEADPTRWISRYSATSPVEDIAETWTAFVLRERPVGASVADEKIRFFWVHPDMRSLRAEIRIRSGLDPFVG